MVFYKYLLFVLFVPVTLVGLSACSDNGEPEPVSDDLELLGKYKISVLEPSVLAIDPSGEFLYTVSDRTNKVYKLSTEGDVLKTYLYEGNDLEGVSVYTGDKLLLAEERLKQLVEYNPKTNTGIIHRIAYENTDENSGIEGVAYDDYDGTIFMLNEKNPGLLLRLRSDFSIIKTYQLDFAGDYSGIFYEKAENALWIVSDQSKTINKCNLFGKRSESYSVNINKVEGIALTKDKIYVVSDADAYLYVYKRPH